MSSLEGHADSHTVTVVVRCSFIGCDWSIQAGTATFEAHQAYIDHLDVHDPDHIAAEEPECEATEDPGLYAGDSAEQIATAQARVDRFMAGGGDR